MQHDRPMMDRPCREISGKQWVRYDTVCGCMWELEHFETSMRSNCTVLMLDFSSLHARGCAANSLVSRGDIVGGREPQRGAFCHSFLGHIWIHLDMCVFMCFHCFSWPMFSPNHFRSGLEI